MFTFFCFRVRVSISYLFHICSGIDKYRTLEYTIGHIKLADPHARNQHTGLDTFHNRSNQQGHWPERSLVMFKGIFGALLLGMVLFSLRPVVPNYDALQQGVEEAQAAQAAEAPALPSIREVGGFGYNASTMMVDPLANWDFMPDSPPIIIDGRYFAKLCKNMKDAGTSPQGTILDGHSCGCLKDTLHCVWR